jgi:hypothetical protein
MAQVVLHLGSAEPWPQVLEQLHELGGHELCLVGRRALEEVELARVVAIGEPQDVNSVGRARMRQRLISAPVNHPPDSGTRETGSCAIGCSGSATMRAYHDHHIWCRRRPHVVVSRDRVVDVAAGTNANGCKGSDKGSDERKLACSRLI